MPQLLFLRNTYFCSSKFKPMRTFVAVLFLIIFSGCMQNQKDEATGKESSVKEHNNLLTGTVSRDQLEADPEFASFFREEYEAYDVKPEIVAAEPLNEVEITLVLATWCHDSQVQVPRFFKILDESNYAHEVKIIAVNRQKVVPGMDISELRVERVPTFIFLKKNQELGRIIESPSISLEEDIVAILKNQS